MGRPAELKTRIARNVIFENDDLVQFENMVGRDNVSKEIRALVHNFLEDQKKGDAQLDPLNLVRHDSTQRNEQIPNSGGINTTLDIYMFSKKEIRDYISKIEDIKTLAKIQDNGYVFFTVARTRKNEIIPLEKARNELKK